MQAWSDARSPEATTAFSAKPAKAPGGQRCAIALNINSGPSVMMAARFGLCVVRPTKLVIARTSRPGLH